MATSIDRRRWAPNLNRTGKRCRKGANLGWISVRLDQKRRCLTKTVVIWGRGPGLGDLRSIFDILSLFGRLPKSQCDHEWPIDLVSGANFVRATCIIFRTGSVPGAPGSRRGPRSAENRPTNPEPDLSLYLPQGLPNLLGCAALHPLPTGP